MWKMIKQVNTDASMTLSDQKSTLHEVKASIINFLKLGESIKLTLLINPKSITKLRYNHSAELE